LNPINSLAGPFERSLSSPGDGESEARLWIVSPEFSPEAPFDVLDAIRNSIQAPLKASALESVATTRPPPLPNSLGGPRRRGATRRPTSEYTY